MLRTGICGFIGLLLLTACGPDKAAEEPLRLPEREETWVKTEEVDITKDAALAPKSGAAAQIPINSDLQSQLTKTSCPAPKSPIHDTDSCMALLDPLDKTRMFIQREGGAWGMFERSELVKPYSDNGMQIDSQINKLVFSLRYLCQTAQGVPQNELALKVNEVIDRMGKEKAREHFIEVVGEAPADVDLWLKHAEFSKKNMTRKVPYPEIQALILNTQPLIDLYKDLLNRQVDESNKDAFLSDSFTLLTVVKDRLANEPRVVMAMKEDTEAPLQHRWEM
ncbi:MAG: hypothetical protein JRF72_14410 [Deltaproteobacteria bacterium]|jgi:hypothetical protein|nr:hypothetical protein [Deltaproteobacteria bacterium]